jgi:hypothetical protein
MRFPGRRRLSLVLCFAALAARAHAGDQPEIGYQDGLLTIRCADAPRGGVLDRIKAATGMTLILEGVAAGTRLTADVPAQPASLALQRLLEGTGVDYALVMERSDPRRVATLYVGDRKAAAAAPSTAAPRATPPPRSAPMPATEIAPVPLPPTEDDGLMGEEADLVAELDEEATGAVSAPATPGEPSRLDRRSRVRRRGQAGQAAQ